MTDRSTPPPYSEEQATAWLAWLAYNMHLRELTIFQIENLQPDWLVGRKETTVHLLLTRMLWSAWAGLLGSLVIGLLIGLFGDLNIPLFMDSGDVLLYLWDQFYFIIPPNLFDKLLNLHLGMYLGLLGGLLGALLSALVELIIQIQQLNIFLQTHNSLIKSLTIGTIICGLLVRLFRILSMELDHTLFMDLYLGLFGIVLGVLIFRFIRTSRIVLREADNHIITLESLQWSWQNIRQNTAKALIFGLFLGFLYGTLFGLYLGLSVLVANVSTISALLKGLIDALHIGLYIGLQMGMSGALFSMLIFGLLGGLVGGFQPGAQELKTRPNQGIWLTIRSSIKIGLPAGIIVGTLSGLLLQDVTLGFLFGAATLFILGGWYGGLDVIEHGIIRLIITWRGHAPLNYARFLNYAAEELNFLQKVGGGYIFIHRYLLEHFAEIAVEKGYVNPKAKNLYYPAKSKDTAI